jgi:hypothetical protein
MDVNSASVMSAPLVDSPLWHVEMMVPPPLRSIPPTTQRYVTTVLSR